MSQFIDVIPRQRLLIKKAFARRGLHLPHDIHREIFKYIVPCHECQIIELVRWVISNVEFKLNKFNKIAPGCIWTIWATPIKYVTITENIIKFYNDCCQKHASVEINTNGFNSVRINLMSNCEIQYIHPRYLGAGDYCTHVDHTAKLGRQSEFERYLRQEYVKSCVNCPAAIIGIYCAAEVLAVYLAARYLSFSNI